MSFIERNKAWLLPLLGVFAAGVVYMNIKMLGNPTPPPEMAQTTKSEPASPDSAMPSPSQMPLASPSSSASSGEADLWSDLKALATPPAQLLQQQDLEEKAAQRIPPEILRPPSPSPSTPIPSFYEPPTPKPTSEIPSGPSTPPPPPPDPEFILLDASGGQVFIQGQSYRVGDKVQEYVIQKIHQASVIFRGPGGQIERRIQPYASPETK